MAKAGSSHDVTLASVGGTARGFMLARDRRGRRTFEVRDYRGIPPTQRDAAAELSEEGFPPDVTLYWSQEDWSKGMGGRNYRLHPKQLASTAKIETSHDGKIRPHHEVTAATVDNNPSQYVPSGFGGIGAREVACIGNYFYWWDYTNSNFDRQTQPFNATRLFRNGVNFGANAYFPSWADDAGSGGSYTGDDLPTDYVYLGTTGNPTAPAVSATLPNAFKYFVVANGKLWGGYTTVPSVLPNFLDGDAAGTVGIDTSQTTIYYRGGSSGMSVGEVMRIDSELMLVTADSGGNALTVVRGYRGTVAATHTVGSTGYKMTTNVHQVRSSTDPTSAANWSSAVTIGDAGSEITALVGIDTDLLVCKTDGLYLYSSAGATTELLPELKGIRHPHNFRGAFLWNDKVLLPLGAGGLLELDTSDWSIRDISFSRFMPELTDLHARVVAISGDVNRVYLLCQNNSTSTKFEIVMGEWLTIDGSTDYRWSHVGTITATTGTDAQHAALYASGVPSATSGSATAHRRLLAGVESTGSSLLPYYVPFEGDANNGYTNDTDAYAITTEWDGGLPKVDKHFASIDLETENLGAGGRQFTVSYRIDAGSWTTDLTDAAGNADGVVDTSPNQTMTFPAGTTGKILELKVVPALTSVGTTPAALVRFRVTAQLRTAQLVTVPLSLYLADRQTLLNGAKGGASKTDLSQLNTWDAQAAEVTLVTPDGTSRTCVFLPGYMRVREIAREKGRRSEYVVTCLLADV